MSEGSFIPTEQDISDYEALKPELLRHLRKGMPSIVITVLNA